MSASMALPPINLFGEASMRNVGRFAPARRHKADVACAA
jgi:hypothetical protein